MPKQRFFSIPPSKQETILRCALEEFSQQEYHNASINRIIRSAGIPRGSFYQYFDDKEDLFFHLLESILQQEHTAFFEKESECPQDPIGFHQMMFRFNLSMLDNLQYRGFFRGLFLAMNYQFGIRYREVVERSRAVLISHVGPEDAEKAARISETLEVLGLITMDLLALKALKNLPDHDIWQRYHAKLRLLGLEPETISLH